MVKVRSLSLLRSSTPLLIALAAMVSNGCTTDRARRQSYDRKIQRTQQLLIAAGDPDSLAAAAVLRVGPTVDPVERLALIERAVSKAPDRPDLAWLNIRLCTQVDACNPEPLEAQLRTVDPDNGAAWVESIGRAASRADPVAVRKDLSSIAASSRFDTYWNATIAHGTNAILKTHTMDLPTALVFTIGVVSATTLPPYQAIVKACRGESLQDPEVLSTCRRVSTVMRRGDTYITEMVGIAIAKNTWPAGSPTYVDAISARRVAHYRMDADGKLSLHRFMSSKYAAERLQLMTDKKTEQEVNVAEIENARWSANPPPDYADPWSGS